MPMVTKLDRVGTCSEELLLINLHDLSITWFYEVTWKNLIFYISTCIRPVAAKHGTVVTYRNETPPINPQKPLNVVTWGHVADQKHNSTTTMPMVSKLVRVVTYHEKLQPINLHNPSMRWFFEDTTN